MTDDIGDIKNKGEPQAGQERQSKERETIDHGFYSVVAWAQGMCAQAIFLSLNLPFTTPS